MSLDAIRKQAAESKARRAARDADPKYIADMMPTWLANVSKLLRDTQAQYKDFREEAANKRVLERACALATEKKLTEELAELRKQHESRGKALAFFRDRIDEQGKKLKELEYRIMMMKEKEAKMKEKTRMLQSTPRSTPRSTLSQPKPVA